jgi:cytoskeletal protein CcmA (bactofilin family)
MGVFGKSIRIKGEVHSTSDLTIEGHVDGPIMCEGHALQVSPAAAVEGEVIARDVTVFGKATGQIIATEMVDIRSSAQVHGKVLAPRVILHEGGVLQGRVEPQHVDAALSVSKFRRKAT